MKKIFLILIVFTSQVLLAQYAPAAGEPNTTAIYMDSSIIVAWATGYKDTLFGEDVDDQWKTPEKALGKAQGTSGDIVCLGRSGEITFTFDAFIINQEGPDFVTFENGFSDTFLELGWVEVSQDGINFVRFPNHSLTEEPVDAFGDVDPTKINGYCSKYKQGYGTPFDLDSVHLDSIRFVKLIDISGEGNAYDSDGHIIYDPYKTTGSAGLDIDAIGVIHAGVLQENIKEVSKHQLRIYPNPAQDILQIEFHTSHIKQLVIYDLSGEMVKEINLENYSALNTYQIQVDDLKNGIYFLRIDAQKYQITKKLIISR